MPEFTLPSGRIIELHDPLFGELMHASILDAENVEELLYAKFAIIAPNLTREEIFNLNRTDGLALMREVGRIWDGRPEEQEVPFEQPSPLPSAEENPKTPTP